MKPLADIKLDHLLGTTPAPAQPPATTPATPPPAPETSARRSSPAAGPSERPQWDRVPIRDCPQAQDELTRLLYQTFASQKSYGDKAQMMGYRDGMFQLVLGSYSFAAVREAFIRHVSRKADLPSPSDIVNLIDPPKEPLSAAVYTALKRRIEDGYYPLSEEKAYLRAFEQQELAKVAGVNRDHPDTIPHRITERTTA